MKIKYLIPVLILLMLLSVAPVHAIAPLNVTDDILPSSLIINASEQDRCYGLYGTDIDWNGGDVDVNLLEMYIQTSSEPNVVNITFYYDSASVNGNITTSYLASGSYSAYRVFNISIGSDSDGWFRHKTKTLYAINYGRNDLTGDIGIILREVWSVDVIDRVNPGGVNPDAAHIIYDAIIRNDPFAGLFGLSSIQGFSQVANVANLQFTKVFFPQNKILDTPITRFTITSTAPVHVFIWYASTDTFKSQISSEGLTLPFHADIIKLLTSFIGTLTNIATGIFVFEMIVVVNAPWIFLMVEVIGSMLVIWGANGSIFRVVTDWWRLQQRIIDFFMYIPSFVEKHWQLSIIITITSIIGYIGKNMGHGSIIGGILKTLFPWIP